MEASDATQTQDTEQAQTGQAGDETATPDMGEALSALTQKVDSLVERSAPEDDDAPISDDLLDALLGPEEDPQTEPAPDDDLYDLRAEDDIPQFRTKEEFDAYVQEQAQAPLNAYALQQMEQERRGQLDGLAEKYPDFREKIGDIRDVTHDIAARYGNDHLATDPAVAEMVYKAIKADEASEAETPAETAATAGASLETGTGPGSQGQTDDPDQAIKDAILDSGGPVFPD